MLSPGDRRRASTGVDARTLSDTEWDWLSTELIAFFASHRGDYLPPGHHQTVFPDGSVAAAAGVIVETNRPTYAAMLTFAQADEMAPFQAALNKIKEKRLNTYDMCDPLGSWARTIIGFREVNVNILQLWRAAVVVALSSLAITGCAAPKDTASAAMRTYLASGTGAYYAWKLRSSSTGLAGTYTVYWIGIGDNPEELQERTYDASGSIQGDDLTMTLRQGNKVCAIWKGRAALPQYFVLLIPPEKHRARFSIVPPETVTIGLEDIRKSITVNNQFARAKHIRPDPGEIFYNPALLPNC